MTTQDDDDEPSDEGIVDPRVTAEDAGLRYVSDSDPGITRVADGEGWSYRGPTRRPVRNAATLDRIAKLAIPPAYTDVWICADARGHLQATGRDARGRKQYRYHADFRAARDANKFEHMLAFARALPRLRERIDSDMRRHGLPREKMLATIVYLLETTLIRVGNDEYAKTNDSFGLTTLNDQHVEVDGQRIRFRFKGKSNKEWNLSLKDRRIARIVKASQDIPGEHLFQYYDAEGQAREITSGDVNGYLKEVAGASITAKDFRTWAGTVLAATALADLEEAETTAAIKKQVKAAIEKVAAQLGNTPTICRKCYVHPEIIGAHMERALTLTLEQRIEHAADGAGLRDDERAVLHFLTQRLGGGGVAMGAV